MRSSVGAPRSRAGAGTPTPVSRFTWRVEPGASVEAGAIGHARSLRAVRARPRRRAPRAISVVERRRSCPASQHVASARAERGEPLGGVVHDDARRRRRRERDLLPPTSPCAPRASTVGRDREHERIGARRARERRRRVGPRGAVHRALLPPRPHLFGHERQERREQPQQRRERDAQRDRGRARVGVADLAVRAALHQLDVVVAEPPEEPLGALERPGVVVRVERGGRVVDERRRARRASPGRARSVTASTSSAAASPDDAEHELRRVEDLDRELAADLHLPRVERGVDARAGRCTPSSAPRRRRTARAAASA